jgi:hypothetical protein
MPGCPAASPPERHQRHVAVGDAVKPQRDRDAPHKGRRIAAIELGLAWYRYNIIFGHDVRIFLR